METTARTTPATAHRRTQLSFGKAKLIVTAYGALSSVVLLTVVIRAFPAMPRARDMPWLGGVAR